MNFNIDLAQLRNIDLRDVSKWPLPVKAAAVVAISVVVLGSGIWFDTRAQLAELDTARAKELTLKTEFTTKQARAANLDAYKAQMAEMKLSFGTMLRQLPSKTEVAELLVDISQTGLESGLEFELFKPESEAPADFYAELPIKIKVTGLYHEFGRFVSNVAALPRIVTLHDFSIKAAPAKDRNAVPDELIMEVTAKTYRYLEEGETAAIGKEGKT